MFRTNTRMPAEWEPQDAVQLTWPNPKSEWGDSYDEVVTCLRQIAKAISESGQRVLIVCDNRLRVREELALPEDLPIMLFYAPSNDTWARDYGPISVYTNRSATLMDYFFNGWGEKYPFELDNRINGIIEEQGPFACALLGRYIVLEGGALETDGQGTLLATRSSILNPNRNPLLDEATISKILSEDLGFERICWLEDAMLLGDDTDGHIDTLARFADPNTILYVCTNDEQDPHFGPLQSLKRQLGELRTLDGQPYRLIELPLPPPVFCPEDGHRLPATYANFLITNHLLLIPYYGVAEDEEAMQILSACFPDRKAIGIDCQILIRQGGSLHCMTMNYAQGTLHPPG